MIWQRRGPNPHINTTDLKAESKTQQVIGKKGPHLLTAGSLKFKQGSVLTCGHPGTGLKSCLRQGHSMAVVVRDFWRCPIQGPSSNQARAGCSRRHWHRRLSHQHEMFTSGDQISPFLSSKCSLPLEKGPVQGLICRPTWSSAAGPGTRAERQNITPAVILVLTTVFTLAVG